MERARPSRLLAAEQSWLNRTHCVARSIGFNIRSRALSSGLSGAPIWEGFLEPRGKRTTINNLYKFCRQNRLDCPSLIRQYQGRCKLKSYKSWTPRSSVRQRDYIRTYGGFVTPNGKPVGEITNLAELCRGHELDKTHWSRLPTAGSSSTAAGHTKMERSGCRRRNILASLGPTGDGRL